MYQFLLFAFSLAAVFLLQGREEAIAERPKYYVLPPESITHLHFGYNESLADSLWLRYIQDIDRCGKMSEPELKEKNINQKNCEKGWSFHLIDAVTRLAPRFRMPYALGATNLTVLVNDHQGADIIFERGIKYFPDDWPILYRAAYFYMYEHKDDEKAANLLDRVAKLGAPIWVSSLASKIWNKAGRLEFGIRSLMDYKNALIDQKQKEFIQSKIDKLVAEYEKQQVK